MMRTLLLLLGAVLTACSTQSPQSPATGGSGPAAAPPQQAAAAPAAPSIQFTNENWGLAMSDADKHKGSPVRLTGRVFQEQHDPTVWALQIWTDPEKSTGNTMIYYRSSDPGVASRGDFIEATGTVQGVFEGENAFGA